MIVSVDLSQVEVIVFADYCRDKMLNKLLLDGLDLHRFTAAHVAGKDEIDITTGERKLAKAGNFGIIYGNGAPRLAQTTGNSVEWCAQYIKEFYELFPGAKEWHKNIQDEVNKTGQLRIWTGETLKFKKYPAKYDWQKRQGIIESYNPPDIKNHPIQHTAWIITSIMLGKFWREKALHNRDKYLMINTVHDSLMLDVRPEYVELAKKDLQEVVDRLPEWVLQYFNHTMSVPIKCQISVAESWGDLA